MHVVLIGPSPPLRGGVSAHTRGFRLALEDAGHRVDVLSYSRLYPALFFPGRSERDPQSVHVPADLMFDTLAPRTWLAARRVVRRLCPDLIVAQWWHPVTAPALIAVAGYGRRTPLVYCCHNAAPHEPFPGSTIVSRYALSFADGYLCHSSVVAGELRATGLRGPAEVTPMPWLVDPAVPAGSDRELRTGVGVAEDGSLVVLLGHLRRYKGVEVLVRAWGTAGAHASDRLVLAGECYLDRALLARWIRRAGCADTTIVLDRYLSDAELVAWLAAADAAVFPYLTASQSGMLPVALAAGRRVIVSDAGGLIEQAVGHCGQPDRGLAPGRVRVVPAGDATALSAALAEVLRDPRRRGGASRYTSGWRATESGWSRTVEALESLHRRLTRR